MRSYTFHVSLPGMGRLWRKIEMRADQTLEDLHFAIQDAYGWGADHLYSFFMSGRAWDGSTEYRLPEDCDPWGVSLHFEEGEVVKMEIEEGEEEIDDLTPEEFKQHMYELFGGGEGMTEQLRTSLDVLLERFIAEIEGPGNVQTTTLAELDLKPQQKFMYLFDYGDAWRFKVRVHAINDNADPDLKYPRLVQSVGKAPPQYPMWDEDEH
jgi:hypothetical protein